MAKELKLRRGNTTAHAAFVGAEGEITFNTDRKSAHLHDGITSGGFEVARNDLSNVSNADFLSKATSAGATGGGGSGGTTTGADANASYLIIGTDTWGLINERRLQVTGALEATDGGSGGGYTLSVKLANAVSGPPSNLGAASFGGSTYVARADHVHAMPTATDVSAVPNTRVIQPGLGLAVTNGGLLTANTTVSLNAVLSDLSNVQITNASNNDLLVYNGASSKWQNFSGNTLGRMTVRDEDTVVGTANAITTINFVGGGVTATVDGTDTSKIHVTVPTIFNQEQVEDIIGGMVSGNTESGVVVSYDDTLGKLNFDVNDFTITLTGDVQATGTVTDLGNLSLNTVIAANSIALGADTTGNYVATISPASTSNGIVVNGPAAEGSAIELSLNLSDSEFIEGVQDIIGTMVSGNIESGLAVTYNDAGGKLNFDVADFSITLQGAVEGSGFVTNLTNVILSTNLAADAVTLGTHTTGNYVSSITGASNGITITGSGSENAAVGINLDLNNAQFVEGVQDIVGTMVSPTNVENGISVSYDDLNGKLDFDVADFAITLSGDVTGTATVTNLGNVNIAATVAANSVALGADTTGNYVGSIVAGSNGVTVTNTGVEGGTYTIGLDLGSGPIADQVIDTVGNMVSGNVENGIAVTYNVTTKKLDFDVNDPTLTLTGPITGSATMTNLANFSLATSLANDSVSLGTHTVGNYVATLAGDSNGVTVTGAGTEGRAAVVSFDLGNANFVETVQDLVGGMVTATNVENGIAVSYDDVNGKLDFDVADFSITLTGDVTGVGTVTNLGNVSFATTVAANSVALGADTTGNYVATVAAGANGVVVTGSGSETSAVGIDIDLSNTTFTSGIQGIVGAMVSGNTESGVDVTFAAGKLNFNVNDPVISLAGALTGSATMTNLANVAITAALANDAVTLGTHTTGSYVATVAAASNGITVTGSGAETAAVSVGLNLADANFVEGVQDIVGTMVTTGNIESGIAVVYDDIGGVLNFDVADFSITLTGDVTGTGTVTNLGNVSFATTVAANSVALGADTTGNYVASVAPAATSYGITVTGAAGEGSVLTLALNPADSNFVEGVQDIVGSMVTGNTESGIAVTYNDTTGVLDFDVNDFTLTLSGALTGAATVTNLGSATLNATLADNSVALGQQTTGNYIGTVVAALTSNGIVVAGGAGGEGSAVTVGFDLSDVNYIESVQDIVGTMVTGNVESGIAVTYNDAGAGTGKLDFDVADFTLSLTGAMTGSTTVTNLGNASITTTIAADSVTLGTHTAGNYVATVAPAATANGIVVTSGTGEGVAATIGFNLLDANFVEAVQDQVATMYDGAHTAITSTYNDATGKITLAVTNGVIDAGTLGTYAAIAFPRKAEAASITNTWSFANDLQLTKFTLNTITFTDALAISKSGVGAALEIDANRNVKVSAGTLSVGTDTVIHTGNLSNALFKEAVEDYVATLFSNGTHGNLTFVYDDANAKISASVVTAGLNADTLDTYDSLAFARKAENASITGQWSFTTPAGTSATNYVKVTDGTVGLDFYPNLVAGSYNGIVGLNDAAIVGRAATQGAGALTLTTWATGTSGIRITGDTVNVEGIFTRGGVNVLTEATGFRRAATHLGSGFYDPDVITATGFSSGDVSIDSEPLRGYHIHSSFRPGGTTYGTQLAVSDTDTNTFKMRSKINGTWSTWNNVWTEGNDGAGSGLDADKLDGIESATFLRTDISQTYQGTKFTYLVANGTTVSTGGDSVAPLEIVQPNSVTGDSFMTFHMSGRFATHFGLDSATNDLFLGGWSAGATKNRVFHKGNIHRVAETLRSNNNVTGGGTLSFDGTNVKWSARMMMISGGNGSHFSTTGYFECVMPTSGTILGVGGAANKTVTTSGIPLGGYEALYYILPIGSNHVTVNANFRVVSYTGALEIPDDWVLIANFNGDDAAVRFSAAPAVRLRSGENYSTANGQIWGMSFSPDANNTRNVGTASLRYNTMYATTFNGTATSAQYADVAERYSSDAEYAPGTVVVFGGDAEVTISNEYADRRVAGVISTDPAFMMNSEAGSDTTHPYVALVGRVPCLVTGTIRKGDMLTTSNVVGHARATADPKLGSIIGKALEDFDGESGMIEIAVQRM